MKRNIGKILAIVLVIALCTVFFAACVPSDYTKAKANLEEADYAVVVLENGNLLNAANAAAATMAAVFDVELTGKCEYVVDATNLDDSVTIYYFDNSKDAAACKKATKAFVDKYKDELKKNLDEGKITKERYDEAIEDMKDSAYGAFGKVFWTGTKAGVKAAG